MRSDENRITRRQLYEQVWATPIVRLAKQYGLSDVGLGKICKKHNIPKPRPGHWAKVQNKVPTKKVMLPDPDVNPEIAIRANRPPVPSSPEPTGFTNIFSRAVEAEAYLPSIIFDETARDIKPWDANSLHTMRLAGTDKWGRCLPEDEEALTIQVSKKQRLRAHHIMNTLLKELENRGCEIFPADRPKAGTYVGYCGEFIAIRIIELLEDITVTSRYSSDVKSTRSDYYEHPPQQSWPDQQSFKLTGRLMLSLVADHYIGEKNLRRNWRDTEHQSLDKCLNDIIVGIIRMAAAQRNQNAKWAISHAESEERQREAKISGEKEAHATALVSKLDTEIASWAKAQSIRDYVIAARNRIKELAQVGNPNLERWLQWAETRANHLDPLSSILSMGMDVGEQESEFYVRPEFENESENISTFVRQVYENIHGNGYKVASFMNELRACNAFDPELSLIAIRDNTIIGYALFTNVGVRNRPGICGVAISPLCVRLKNQHHGIGTKLVTTGIETAVKLGKKFVYVHNSQAVEFFKNFDFKPASDQGIRSSISSQYSMFLPIGDGAVKVGQNDDVEHPTPWTAFNSTPAP